MPALRFRHQCVHSFRGDGGVHVRRRRGDAASSKLPPRGEFIVTNAYVFTMDRRLGEIDDCSVHVRDGVIVGVGRDLAAPGVTAIDGRDMIVLPGLIDTHWHMWQTLYRCFAGDQADKGFFPTHASRRT